MTARGLSLSRREPGAGATRRHAPRRSTVTFFGPGPAFCFRSSLDQAAMAALGVVAPGVLGVVLPRAVASRFGGRHTLLRLTGPPPVGDPHEQGWGDV